MGVRDGRFFGSPQTSEMEETLFRKFHSGLADAGFEFLSVPSLVKLSTLERQGVIALDQAILAGDFALSGSAEQGILELFADTPVAPGRYWSHNQCFRKEQSLDGLMRLLEFKKTELFSFCLPNEWEVEFEHLLGTASAFLDLLGLTWRVVDRTTLDPGYHILKKDIEVLTKTYGWMETHSCTYFGDGQVKRMGIQGGVHTISNTGLASPRILIPFLENDSRWGLPISI